jgi:hypothetical protein
MPVITDKPYFGLPLMPDQRCDLRRGDTQCPWRNYRTGDEGYLCCAYKAGHTGNHHTTYLFDADNLQWVLP